MFALVIAAAAELLCRSVADVRGSARLAKHPEALLDQANEFERPATAIDPGRRGADAPRPKFRRLTATERSRLRHSGEMRDATDLDPANREGTSAWHESIVPPILCVGDLVRAIRRRSALPPETGWLGRHNVIGRMPEDGAGEAIVLERAFKHHGPLARRES